MKAPRQKKSVSALQHFLQVINNIQGYKISVKEDVYVKWFDLEVKDTSGHSLTTGRLSSSNSGASFNIELSGRNTMYGSYSMETPIAMGNVAKVRSLVIWSLAHNDEPRNYYQKLVQELNQLNTPMPKIVDEIVQVIHECYLKYRGGTDTEIRIKEVKRLFDHLKDHVSEEDILQWFRESQVKDVMES